MDIKGKKWGGATLSRKYPRNLEILLIHLDNVTPLSMLIYYNGCFDFVSNYQKFQEKRTKERMLFKKLFA